MTVTDEADVTAPSARPLTPSLRPGACTVGVLGGTGGQGRGLAYRFGAAGVDVVIGSRDQRRADAAVSEILPPRSGNRGATNRRCAIDSDVVVLAVPWLAHRDVVASLADVLEGKIVIDCCNPLVFDDQGAHPVRVPEGSAAEQAASMLPRSRVVAAFHHVSSTLLLDPARDRMPSLDIMVAGDDAEACALVVSLVDCVPGLRGVVAGTLRHARQIESFSATLISLSQVHRGYTGVTIHGV